METNNEIKDLFGANYDSLDEILRELVKNTIRCYVRLKYVVSFDYQGPLYIEMQKTIEAILEKDFSTRSSDYNTLKRLFR